MKPVARDDLLSVPILVSETGFPGELSAKDAARARWLIQSSDTDAVLVAAGAGSFWWVEDNDQQVARLSEGGGGRADGGFALGAGDGATIPGFPIAWNLLTFTCPEGDTTVLLAQYPHQLPRCPAHDVGLELQDDTR